MMRVSWVVNFGEVHKDMPDEEVMAFCESLSLLGFDFEVSMV